MSRTYDPADDFEFLAAAEPGAAPSFLWEPYLPCGHIAVLEAFGAQVLNDTCWCMITEPVIPPSARNLMTNSGKYAHYGPGLVGRKAHFGSMAECVEAACKGSYDRRSAV